MDPPNQRLTCSVFFFEKGECLWGGSRWSGSTLSARSRVGCRGSNPAFPAGWIHVAEGLEVYPKTIIKLAYEPLVSLNKAGYRNPYFWVRYGGCRLTSHDDGGFRREGFQQKHPGPNLVRYGNEHKLFLRWLRFIEFSRLQIESLQNASANVLVA